MSISKSTGSKSLVQVGVSPGDVGVALYHARRVGNWMHTTKSDDELFVAISEDFEALFKRRGLVEVGLMQRRWGEIDFIYHGSKITDSSGKAVKDDEALMGFSWLMVCVVTALDTCISSNRIVKFIVEVFENILPPTLNLTEALRIQLPNNVECWRSEGRVRHMAGKVAQILQKSRCQVTPGNAVPELNGAEWQEMKSLLVWLMAGNTNDFNCVSATVFAVACSIGPRGAGLHIKTDGNRENEAEPMVHFLKTSQFPTRLSSPGAFDPENGAQQISYSKHEPQQMITALTIKRRVMNEMKVGWMKGYEASANMHLLPTASTNFTDDSDVEYKLYISSSGDVNDIYSTHLGMLGDQGFPYITEDILKALDKVTEGYPVEALRWLHSHTGLEYLRQKNVINERKEEYMDLLAQYQALVFGFYYGLLGKIVTKEFIPDNIFLRGIWGIRSTRFLAMCAQFSSDLRRKGVVTRTHVLYMLSSMYNGRQKAYSSRTSGSGLIGIIGAISVLSTSLLRISDDPKEIGRFVLVDLPIIELAADSNGELRSGKPGGLGFKKPNRPKMKMKPQPPSQEWYVHANMGLLLGDGDSGVVMAARCGGRLVGWFSPLAADMSFLSSSFVKKRHASEVGYRDPYSITGYHITDEDWESGMVYGPQYSVENASFGVVHSKGCGPMRYAAAGIFASINEKVAIATDDIEAAVGFIEGQGGGIIIS